MKISLIAPKSSRNRLKVLISEKRLTRRVTELARLISKDYTGKELIVVGVLKGSFIFMADLIRQLDLSLTCDFLRVSSYGASTQSSGNIRLDFDLTQPIRDKDVLLVEDIIDSGLTAEFVIKNILNKKPATLKICTLLRKHARNKSRLKLDYVGFDIPNVFVVGYGLDLAGCYRNLPYIAELKQPYKNRNSPSCPAVY